MDRRAILPLFALLAACGPERIAGVAVTRHQVRLARTVAEARAAARRLGACVIVATPPAAGWSTHNLDATGVEVSAPADWQRHDADAGTETWTSPDTLAVVFLQVSTEASEFEVSGVQGFAPVPGTLRCAAVLAGAPAPFRIQEFSRLASTEDTLYVAQTEVALPQGRALFAVAAGRGREAAAQALGVLSALHLR